MQIIFWILLGVSVLFFGSAFISGVIEAIKKDKKTAEHERSVAEKYKRRGVLGKYKRGTLHLELLRLGREALSGETPEKAWEYLQDSRALQDSAQVWLALAEYYDAVGDWEKSAEIVDEILEEYSSTADYYF